MDISILAFILSGWITSYTICPAPYSNYAFRYVADSNGINYLVEQEVYEQISFNTVELNQIIGKSAISFSIMTDPIQCESDNGINEICFEEQKFFDNLKLPNAYATNEIHLNRTYEPLVFIEESDIHINSKIFPRRLVEGVMNWSLVHTIFHEILHGFGLEHTLTNDNIMHPFQYGMGWEIDEKQLKFLRCRIY